MAIVFIRTLIVYFSLLAVMRLMGKRQLGEMELSEFVVAALIADLAAHPLQDIGIPMINGLIPIFTLFCLEIIISGISMKSIRFRGFLFGKPSIIISHEHIQQSEMRKNRFTLDELTQELRNQSVTDINTIEYAILETNGNLNIILMPRERPVTPRLLDIKAGDGGYPAIIISEGRIIEENLALMGRDTEWLLRHLRAGSIEDAKNVYLMTLDSAGRVFLEPMEVKK